MDLGLEKQQVDRELQKVLRVGIWRKRLSQGLGKHAEDPEDSGEIEKLSLNQKI